MNKRLCLVLCVLSCYVITGCSSASHSAGGAARGHQQVDSQPLSIEDDLLTNRIVVKLKKGIRINSVSALSPSKSIHVSSIQSEKHPEFDVDIYEVDPNQLDNIVNELNLDPGVEFAEPDYIIQINQSTPNDPYFDNLWGLSSSSNGGIEATKAWEITKGNDIVIAIVDTGINYNHPDLAANMWKNPGETPENGIDDDGNGYVDDIYGWNFAYNTNNPNDDHRHGTHVAGTVAAHGNNSLGVTGVSWRAKLIAVKAFNKYGQAHSSTAANCILYAVDAGASVINASWGYYSKPSKYLQYAIDYAERKGSLVVAAVGNSSTNVDIRKVYPAGYQNDNIIAVAALSKSTKLASFSNYGITSVDIAAPGTSILSTGFGKSYFYAQGTSMAAPMVSGVAGLILAKNPSLSAVEVKKLILDGARTLSHLESTINQGRKLNAHGALLPLTLPSIPDTIFLHARSLKKALYESRHKIHAGSKYKVNHDESVHFKAGYAIDLTPLFDVSRGARFDVTLTQ